MNRAGEQWTPLEDLIVCEAADSRTSNRTVARVLGRSEAAIRQRAKVVGVKRSKFKPSMRTDVLVFWGEQRTEMWRRAHGESV